MKNVEKLYEELKRRYIEDERFAKMLAKKNITILMDFLSNWENVQRFNRYYYGKMIPKVVLCGINPGRFGAGKTGVPFMDFAILSKLIDGIESKESERSAQFFAKIVQKVGPERFYRLFYVTNISWVGFMKDGRNLNFYDLPKDAQKFVYEQFLFEMEYVRPERIIALGRNVQKTIKEILAIEPDYLPHPNFCQFPSKEVECEKRYFALFSKYML